jgi:hypothetical protein
MVQTDRELRLNGRPDDAFPSWLTLWLVGLGIVHGVIRPGRPTDQAQVERTHRTLGHWVASDDALSSLAQLRLALQQERDIHNRAYPSRAGDCHGRPPLEAHPELLTPRRAYQPDLELVLFDLRRVDQYLANLAFERRVTASGQVSLGGHLYRVGETYCGQRVIVCFDRTTREWVFFKRDGDEVRRCLPKGLEVHSLTDLDPATLKPPLAVQLSLFHASSA